MYVLCIHFNTPLSILSFFLGDVTWWANGLLEVSQQGLRRHVDTEPRAAELFPTVDGLSNGDLTIWLIRASTMKYWDMMENYDCLMIDWQIMKGWLSYLPGSLMFIGNYEPLHNYRISFVTNQYEEMGSRYFQMSHSLPIQLGDLPFCFGWCHFRLFET